MQRILATTEAAITHVWTQTNYLRSRRGLIAASAFTGYSVGLWTASDAKEEAFIFPAFGGMIGAVAGVDPRVTAVCLPFAGVAYARSLALERRKKLVYANEMYGQMRRERDVAQRQRDIAQNQRDNAERIADRLRRERADPEEK